MLHVHTTTSSVEHFCLQRLEAARAAGKGEDDFSAVYATATVLQRGDCCTGKVTLLQRA